MPNWARANAAQLKDQGHYVRIPTKGISAGADFYPDKFEELHLRNPNFRLIIVGSEDDQDDFYAIPHSWLADVLTEDTLHRLPDRTIWRVHINKDTGVASVRGGRSEPEKIGVNEFRGQRIDLA